MSKITDLFFDKHFWAAIFAAFVFWFVAFALGLKAEVEWHWIYFVLLLPIVEELAFRGFIQGWITNQFDRLWLFAISYSNLMTSLLFTFVHIWHYGNLMAALVIIPSLIFGFFKDKTGSVLPSMMLHSFYNAGLLLFLT